MGMPGKPQQMEVGVETEGNNKKWVIAGIPFRSPLKRIFTNPVKNDDEDQEYSTTPTSEESRISSRLQCPPAPRKRKPSSRCHLNGSREFFTPPDLDTVFIRRAEKA